MKKTKFRVISKVRKETNRNMYGLKETECDFHTRKDAQDYVDIKQRQNWGRIYFIEEMDDE